MSAYKVEVKAKPPLNALLDRIGSRTRERRRELGLSLKALSERAGLSARFLSDVEAGKGNIAIGRLDALADALEVPLVSLLRAPASVDLRAAIDRALSGCSDEELRGFLRLIEVARGERDPSIIALLGVRGAGKTTVGIAVAEALSIPFVELTRAIEQRAGMSLGDLFGLHGEAYVRTIEHRCLSDLVLEGTPCIVALPGGIVTHAEAFELALSSCHTVWLHADASSHWERVFAQGDTRPMHGRDDAREELERLIARREPLYRRAAQVVHTSRLTREEVVRAVLRDLDRTTASR